MSKATRYAQRLNAIKQGYRIGVYDKTAERAATERLYDEMVVHVYKTNDEQTFALIKELEAKWDGMY